MYSSGSPQVDRTLSNDRSGTDQSAHVSLYPVLRSWPGRLAIASCLGLQRLFLRADLGSGYVLRARRSGGRAQDAA